MREVANISAPHNTHCLADGNVMISSIGDAKENGKGQYVAGVYGKI